MGYFYLILIGAGAALAAYLMAASKGARTALATAGEAAGAAAQTAKDAAAGLATGAQATGAAALAAYDWITGKPPAAFTPMPDPHMRDTLERIHPKVMAGTATVEDWKILDLFWLRANQNLEVTGHKDPGVSGQSWSLLQTAQAWRWMYVQRGIVH